MAGVSAGTVDRVIHNRGNVSKVKLDAVRRVLDEIGYEPNLFLSSISLSKIYNIAIAIPMFSQGEYWDKIYSGCLKFLDEYDNISINYKLYCYDQYDIYSCKKVFSDVAQAEVDAVVIGSIFYTETIRLASILDQKKCPYIYVDSNIIGTNPVTFFSADQFSLGNLIAKLLTQVTPAHSEYVHFREIRLADESANNTILRKIGLMDHLESVGKAERIHTLNFSIVPTKEDEDRVINFFKHHKNVKGVVVLSSKGSIVSDILKRCNIDDVRIICMDITAENENAITSGEIDYAICQHPRMQGFLAIRNIMTYLLFGECEKCSNYMPIDILTKENIKYYRDLD